MFEFKRKDKSTKRKDKATSLDVAFHTIIRNYSQLSFENDIQLK